MRSTLLCVFVVIAACTEKANPTATRSASPDASAQTSAASKPVVVSASAPPSAEPAPTIADCAGLADKFEKLTTYHAACDLFAPQKKEELPPPFTWEACKASKEAAPPKDCTELSLPQGYVAEARFDASVSPPLLLVAGEAGKCTLFVSMHLDGTPVTAAAAKPFAGKKATAKCKSRAKSNPGFAAGGGTFMLGVDGEERTADFQETILHRAWIKSKSDAFLTAQSLDNDHGELPDSLTDKLWVGMTGEFASSDAKKASNLWSADEPASLAVGVASDEVLGIDGAGARLGLNHEDAKPSVLVKASEGTRITGAGSDGKTIAWIEQTKDRCALVTSPFAKTKEAVKRRELGDLACASVATPGHATVLSIADGMIFIGSILVREKDGRRWDIKTAVCKDATTGPCRLRVLGTDSGSVYWQEGLSVRRAPLDAFGEGTAPESAKP